MIFRLTALLTFAAMIGFQPALAEDCETATQLTREAESLPLAARITAYQSARAHCPSDPKTHYREGMVLMASAKYPQANEAFKNALDGVVRQTAPPAMRLEILGRLAENEYRREDRPQALARFKIAREFAHANQLTLPKWMVPLQMDLDKQLDSQPLSSAEIKVSMKGMRDLGIEPSVDYRVLFDTDSDRLTPEAEQQLGKVADSMSANGSEINVIGHTDQRGTEAHNQLLSERRAKQVATWLANHHPSLTGRLNSMGKGKSDPKYEGNSDEVNQMNRRVEFVFRN